MIFATKTQVKWYPAVFIDICCGGIHPWLATDGPVPGDSWQNHDTIALWWQRYLVRMS